MDTPPRKLNLGCGSDIKEGWINLDYTKQPGIDVVHNIEDLPLPFEDNSIDEIQAQDILEHVHYLPVLKDIYRILKPGGDSAYSRPALYLAQQLYRPDTHSVLFN